MTLRQDNSLYRAGESLGLENIHIGIAGLIGAGKTTLATALAKVLNVTPYFEKVVDNVYLADFYKDPKKHSFALQIYLLNHRFRQQQQVIWQGKGGVQDRTIYEDSVFAKMLRDSGLLDERDYQTYCQLFANMSNFMNKPNLIIFLDVTAEESYARIKQRARDCEATIPLEYLQNLHRAYQEFIMEISRAIPVIRVNYSTFRTAEEMASMIKEEYEKMRLIHTVTFDKSSAAGSSSVPSE